jgi:hypothetical protein
MVVINFYPKDGLIIISKEEMLDYEGTYQNHSKNDWNGESVAHMELN